MPLVVCYEIYLARDNGRPIYLTRVRDASNALNIAQHQVKILNESWLQRVAWTASVIETLVDEDKLDADDPAHEPKQGDTINEQQVQRAFTGGAATGGSADTFGTDPPGIATPSAYVTTDFRD